MGCDIHGWIEIKPLKEMDWWRGVIDISGIFDRNYELFGFLFGVRNYSEYKPITDALGHGLPTRSSERAVKDYADWGGDAHSPRHITYNEIMTIDWSIGPSSATWIFEYDAEGKHIASFRWSMITESYEAQLQAGEAVTIDGKTYKKGSLAISYRRTKNWLMIEALMTTLAGEYGNDNVRMVVWFDN